MYACMYATYVHLCMYVHISQEEEEAEEEEEEEEEEYEQEEEEEYMTNDEVLDKINMDYFR